MSKSKISESELENRIKNGSKNIEDYRGLGKFLLDRGEYEKLLKLYEKTSSLPLTTVEKALIIHEKGEALDFLGETEAAILCYEQSLQLISEEKEYDLILDLKGMNHYNLSLLLTNDEKGYECSKQALEEFKQLLEKYPDYEEKYLVSSYLAELYGRFGEFDKALDTYKKALKISKNNDDKVGSLSGLAFVYSEKGDYKKSEEIYNQVLKIAKNKNYITKIYFNIGEMYFKSNRFQKAIEFFNNALKYIDRDPFLRNNKEYIADIFWYLGKLNYYNNDCDKAIEYLTKALQGINENHVYYCNTQTTLGHCYFAKENYSKARDHYNIVLLSPLATDEEKNMANQSLAITLGILTYYNNDYDKAIEYLSKASQDINENDDCYCTIHITFGHCYFAKGNYSKARDHYNIVLSSPLATDEEKNMANQYLKEIRSKKWVEVSG